MRIVLVSSFPAYPSTAGNRSRICRLALAIRELGHELTFILLGSRWEASDDAAHEAVFGKGNYIRLDRKHWIGKWLLGAVPGAIKRVLRQAGIEAAYYSALDRFRDREIMARLSRLDLNPDAVIVEYVLDSWAFEAFPRKVRRVLDTHDAFADRHLGYVAHGIGDYWVSLRPESENAGFRRAQVVLAIQEEEAQRFRRQLAAEGKAADPEIAVVGHLLDTAGPEVDYRVGESAVFVASDNAANRHALGALLRDILPLIVREIPDFELKLAGAICKDAPDLPNVTKLGWVDDMKSMFARTPLSINPMRAGTGINIKLLEAMAAGVPSVSTVTGARGLPENMRGGVCVVDDEDAQGFAAAVVRFARDPILRRATGMIAGADARRWNSSQLAELSRCLAAAG